MNAIGFKMLRDADSSTSPKQNALRQLQDASTTVYLRIEVPTNAQQTLFEAWEISGRFSDWGVSAPLTIHARPFRKSTSIHPCVVVHVRSNVSAGEC